MSESTGNKAIAKNTILLYFRMLVTMIVSLYTSRVVLQVLGVDDYGIYQAVGSIVGLLAIVNNALSSGTSRFITFGLGEGNSERLKKIFSTTLTIHIVLALIIVLLAETVGLWFLHDKMVIPIERFDAALFTFQFSVLTAFVSLTQVPYNACIIAHEKMNVYAYASIAEVLLKLLIVYLLAVGDVDKLKLYAVLYCAVHVFVMLFYRFYCSRHFDEAHFKLLFDKTVFKEVAGFSGWSMIAATGSALNGQGVLLLLNMFFTPAVVTARSISLQVNDAAHQLVVNFQKAALPQIVKKYASKDYDGSKRLLLASTRISFYLMLMVCLPVFLTAEQLLGLWLVKVPEYTVIFLQLVVVQSLFQVLDTSFYQALYAKGRLRENALISPVIGMMNFPIVYVLFKLGYSPVVLSWVSLAIYMLLGMVIKPILIVKIVDYKWQDILSVFFPCFKVLFCSAIIPFLTFIFMSKTTSIVLCFVFTVLISIISVAICSWLLGIDSITRRTVKEMIFAKLKRR